MTTFFCPSFGCGFKACILQSEVRAARQQVLDYRGVTIPGGRIQGVGRDVTQNVRRISGPMVVRRVWSASPAMKGEIRS
jgi:hypothetical protein